ncbi:hypothetical protein [Bradyrhizobium sp.]|uniref:hypothetical protein n=1 Tax=Bradyrhizobium sp. TaxID=376 RepID=UPI0039E3B594
MPLVNKSELARILGVSHTAVAKAVASERITAPTPDENGRMLFDSEKAAAEWQSNSNPAKRRDHKKGGRPRKDGAPTRQHKDASPPAVTYSASETPHHPDRPGPTGGRPQTGGALRGPAEPGGDRNYNQSAAEEKYYKAQLARIDYEAKIGALVPIEAVAKEVEKQYSRVRQRLLGIASKVAPEVALMDDTAVCRAAIEAAVVDALNELTADTATVAGNA